MEIDTTSDQDACRQQPFLMYKTYKEYQVTMDWIKGKVDQTKHTVQTVINKWGSTPDLSSLPEGTLEVVENVRLLDRFNTRKPAVGTLYLTATHLIFVDPNGKKETWILHMHISSVEKLPLTTTGSPMTVRCKTFLSVTFVIPRERDCHDIYTSLLKLSQPSQIEELYAFQYQSPDGTPKHLGWDMFDLQSEYMRQGVPNENWTITKLNRDYELCDTYSQHIYVPASTTTPILVGSSKFRSKGRIPALSYLNRANQAAICRCSQPLAGFSARCVEDEQMLQAIRKANPGSRFMYVVDTRPKINAMVNKAAGKGYENENFYSNIKFQFLGIENIHVMRGSLQKLQEVCELKNPSMSAFLSGLESSGWLKHIKAVLDTSLFIAEAIDRGTSVIVHCSDGWDRTAQTCSLSGMLLDPYYRTIQGIQVLIEKEWLAFGHKFIDRCGYIETVDYKETSPIFTQFIDSVWQVLQQFPAAFEFNERFLLCLHDHVYSCQFGTFIGNCEKDRVDLRLSERTYSLWGYISKNLTDFTNPFYKKEYEITHPVLRPDTNPQQIKFWSGLYNRFETGIHPREKIPDIVSAMKDHTVSLEDHIRLLEKRISSLCKLLGKADEHGKLLVQNLPTMESMEFTALLNDLAEKSKKSIENGADPKTSPGDMSNSLLVEGSAAAQSDTESGFEDSCSQVSKDPNSLQTSLIMSHSDSNENLSIDQLIAELSSVAVDWKSLRNIKHCSCATPFEHFTKRYHCWKCGGVFCTRCIARSISLPGHLSQRRVPVCRPCFREIRHSPSMTDFQATYGNSTSSTE